jgi:uncharacterized protein (DUF2062 family)
MLAQWQPRLRRIFYDLRVEGEGPGREAAALGAGVFIGCLPFYGFHLLLCWITGWLLRLNRLKLYFAANISNPLFAPFLLLAELQTGAWIRRHDLHGLTLETVRQTSPWTFGADLLLGSVVVGLLLGAGVAAATLITGGLRREDAALAALWRRASDPYLAAGVMAWEFARGKLRGDPVYRALLQPGVLPAGGTLVDLGCGTGLALSLLRESPPRFDRLIGVEIRAGAARTARQVLDGYADIVHGDAREVPLPHCRAVLVLDVLHMIDRAGQERIVERIAGALEPGGAAIIREADPGGGAGFLAVRAGNRLKALVTGNWRQVFAFRTQQEWAALLRRHGLVVDVQPASAGTPFANLLLIGRREPIGAAAGHSRPR